MSPSIWTVSHRLLNLGGSCAGLIDSNGESGDGRSGPGSATDLLLRDLRQAALSLWVLLIHRNKEQLTSNL